MIRISRRKTWAGIVVLAGTIAVAAHSAGPDDPGAGRPANPLSVLATDPGYELLRGREGTWDASATFWLMPGAEPTTTKAICIARMTLGGLYLEERITGGSIGGPAGAIPWEVLALTGYDAGKKEYHVTRFMSTAPTPMPERGTWNEAARAMETSGQSRMMYMDLTMRTIATSIDAETRSVEHYISLNGAPEFKGILIELKRRK